MNKRIAVVGFLLGAAIGAGPGIASSIKNWTTRETIKATDLNAALNHIHTVAEAGVDSSRIEDGSIVAADLSDGAVTSAKILDGTVSNDDLAGSITASKLAGFYSGSATHDFASIAAGACETTTVTATGAGGSNNVALCNFDVQPAGGLTRNFYVSGANTVTVQLCNGTAGAIDPASALIYCRVFP